MIGFLYVTISMRSLACCSLTCEESKVKQNRVIITATAAAVGGRRRPLTPLRRRRCYTGRVLGRVPINILLYYSVASRARRMYYTHTHYTLRVQHTHARTHESITEFVQRIILYYRVLKSNVCNNRDVRKHYAA